ncbi:hypothetical protein [Massilia pseudoviolaceinigra]|uniref:hypothetical protein n=1 Tax=Massilia pseudoviolaceinigra TaxID=3057165 RepID=UPI002796DE16|nr:hypothetical protein [Massilia sp. CCM 9206]MDQ1921667.1 hypothetical protein [Massilia sp. CCM 9206]
MTGRPNHSASAPLVAPALRVAQNGPRAAVLIAEWRHLEKLVTGTAPGVTKEALIKQRDAALNAVREVADSYLAKGHP